MHAEDSPSPADVVPKDQVTTNTAGQNQKFIFAPTLKIARRPKTHIPMVLATVAAILVLAVSDAFATVWPSDGTETGHDYHGRSVQRVPRP